MSGIRFKTVLFLAGSAMSLLAGESANLLTTGNFEFASWTGTGWTLDVNTAATAERSIDSITGTAHGGKSFCRVTVTTVSTENWHIQLKDPTYTAKKGYNYHFSMWARSDAANSAQISVYGKDGAYKTSSSMNLTTEWKQYHMVYKADADGAQSVNFAVVLGFAVGTYDIDDVVITEAADEGNIYLNGDFEMDGAGWAVYENGTGKGTMSIETTGAQSGSKFCRVNVTEKGEEDWQVQLSDGSWASEMGAQYTLTFYAKCSEDGTSFQVAANAGASRNYAYLTSSSYNLGTEWQNYEFPFSVDEGADSIVGMDSLTFNFYCGGAVGKYDFDNIKLINTAVVSVKQPVVGNLNSQSSRFEICILPKQLQCGIVSAEKINNISIFDIQGKLYYSRNIGRNENNFNLPRPVSGSWIIKVNGNNSNMSRMIVLP